MSEKYRNKLSPINNEINRADQVRRDDDIVLIERVDLQKIDESFKHFLTDIIKPMIIENGEKVDIPVIYANAEKWVSIQEYGYLRDSTDKIILPLITYRHSSVENRDDLPKLEVMRHQEENRMSFTKTYSKQNQYDNFSILIGMKPIKEIYSIARPDYVRIPYDVIIWTETLDQLNGVVEQFIYHEGRAYGKTHKFTIVVDSYSFDIANDIGVDRLIKCTISAHVNAYFIPEETDTKSNIQKSFTIRKIVWTSEIEVDPTTI